MHWMGFQRKRPRSFLNVAYIYAGNDLLSHSLSRAVQSALRGLTSVFGMGISCSGRKQVPPVSLSLARRNGKTFVAIRESRG